MSIDTLRISVHDVMQRLTVGWNVARADPIHDLATVIRGAVGAEVTIKEIGDNEAALQFAFDDVRLRGFDNIWLIVLGGTSFDRQRMSQLRYQWTGDDRFVTVLATSKTAEENSPSVFSREAGFVVFRRPVFENILANVSPRAAFKAECRAQVARRRLIPFTILEVPRRNMFFGRADELRDLFEMESTSWAIAGPGRIGKSSVLHHYMALLQRLDPVRKQRVAHCDFYDLNDLSEDGIARFLAKEVNSSRKAQDVTAETLRRFLILEKGHRPAGRLELLLDEVDRVSHSGCLTKLAEWAKAGFCRLILCGKGQLYEALHDTGHQLFGRVKHMRLGPLSDVLCHQLFLEPFSDMGFELDNSERIIEEVLHDTGGYPHLIQYLGSELAIRATRTGLNKIDYALFEQVRNDHEVAQFFTAPIEFLNDERTELIALTLLHEKVDKFTVADIHRISAREGVHLTERDIAAMCRKLYINNILGWRTDCYGIAVPGLVRYARKLGYFQARLLELQKRVGRLARST